MDVPGDGSLARVRLLQIADSSFPTGAFAYSHGLEWLARKGSLGEKELGMICAAYCSQVVGGQLLPAEAAAYRARTLGRLCRVDVALDASVVAAAEREAGRAMGERLLSGALDAFALGPNNLALVRDYFEEVRVGRAPGQHAVAFGALAHCFGIEEGDALAALGLGAAGAIIQAAVRLNLIGQGAAGRLLAQSGERIAVLVGTVLAQTTRSRFGAFAPGLEVAAILQPTLTFRMFAS